MATVADLTAILRLKDEMSPGIDSAVKKLTGNIAGVLSFGAAISVATDALKAQGEQEAAMTKLNLALANQGIYSAKTSESLVAYSAALQEVSIFADEVILSAEAMFITFGLNEEQTKRATKAALDLASATGQDLQSAVLAIEKGIQGHTKGLAQFNVTVDASSSETERFTSVMAQLESRIGGSALAATQTYAGQMKVLENQVGEAKEGLGKFLGSVLDVGGGAAQGVNMLKALSNFFGVTLVIAMSEAKAQVLVWIADFADKFAEFGNWLASHPFLAKMLGTSAEAAKEAAVGARDFSGALHVQIDALRAEGDALAASAGHAQVFSNNTNVAVGFSKEAAEAAAKHRKELEELAKAAEKWNLTMLDTIIRQHKINEEEMSNITTQTINKMMEDRKDRIDAAKTAYDGMLHAQIEADNSAVAHAKEVQEAIEKKNEAIFDAIERGASAFGDIKDALVSFGISADSIFGKVLSNAQNLTSAAGGIFKAFTSGDIIDKISAVAKGIFAVGSAIGGLFKNQEIEKVNDLRDAFFKAQGGFEAFSQKMSAASTEDWAKKIFNAKTVEEFNALVKESQGLLDTQKESQQALTDALKEYNFTEAEMGPILQAQHLDEEAQKIYKSWEILKAGGVDLNAEIEHMAPGVNDFLQRSLAAGVAIPESMKPMLEKMAEAGKLLDANGNAMTVAQVDGLNFTQTLTEGMMEVVKSVKELVAALTGIPTHVNTTITTTHHDSYDPDSAHGPGHDPDVPRYAMGTNFVPRTGLAIVHRGEAIIPASQNSAGSGDLAGAIASLSAQLAQQLHPQELARAFRSAGQLA